MAIEIISQYFNDEIRKPKSKKSSSKKLWKFPAKIQDQGNKIDLPCLEYKYHKSWGLISDFDKNRRSFQICSKQDIDLDNLYASVQKSKKPNKSQVQQLEDSKKDSKEKFNVDIFDIALATKIKVSHDPNMNYRQKWKYTEFLSEALGREPWLEIADVKENPGKNNHLFKFRGQEIVNFLALANKCKNLADYNNEKRNTPDNFEQNGNPSTSFASFDNIENIGWQKITGSHLIEEVLLLPKNLPKSGGPMCEYLAYLEFITK